MPRPPIRPRRPQPRRTDRRNRPRQAGRLRALTAALLIALAVALLAVLAARHLTPAPEVQTSDPGPPVTYTVVSGDTPTSIAFTYALDPRHVAGDTGSDSVLSPLVPGTHLTIHTGPLRANINQGEQGDNKSLVVAAARRFGVEPAFALSVAWQESRLLQSAHSSAGAIGIMQVLPDTGDLVSRDLGTPLDIHTRKDNVTVGVFWLHVLLDQYKGDQASALAAYYEGPGNLARRGYLQGTAEYVSRAQQLRRALLVASPQLG